MMHTTLIWWVIFLVAFLILALEPNFCLGMSKRQRNKILTLHNKLREDAKSGNIRGYKGRKQPKAKKMPPLRWSWTITRAAQKWSKKCTIEHTKSDPEFLNNALGNKLDWTKLIGENLGISAGHSDSITQIVKDGWAAEVTKKKISYKKYSFDQETGHYTQMIWGGTYKIGCGLSVCPYESGGKSLEVDYLVCFYSPRGNINGKPIYKT